MTTALLHHRLRSLGWKALDEGQQSDGRWWLSAASCGHTIIAITITGTCHEVWSAACSMALELTQDYASVPALVSAFCPSRVKPVAGVFLFCLNGSENERPCFCIRPHTEDRLAVQRTSDQMN